MKLAHPELKMIIEDKENIINVLVIENEKFFHVFCLPFGKPSHILTDSRVAVEREAAYE